jgi:hypothetical protein
MQAALSGPHGAALHISTTTVSATEVTLGLELPRGHFPPGARVVVRLSRRELRELLDGVNLCLEGEPTTELALTDAEMES